MTASSKELARVGSGCGHVRVAAGDWRERAVQGPQIAEGDTCYLVSPQGTQVTMIIPPGLGTPLQKRT